MKKRMLAIVSLSLALLMLLAGCGKTETESIGAFLQGDAKYTPSVPPVQRGDIMASLLATDFEDATGHYLYLTDTSQSAKNVKHTVFNVETEKAVLFLVEPDGIDYEIAVRESVAGDYFFLLTEKETTGRVKKTFLYNANGEVFAEAAGEASPETVYDMVRFDGKCYLPDANGRFAYACDYPDMMALPRFDHYNDSYYYTFYTNSFHVYSKKLAFVSSYTVPAGASATAMIVMPDGNVLIQTETLLEEDAKEYDILMHSSYSGTVKYDLEALIFNVKSGKTKSIELDYLLHYSNPKYVTDATAKETGINADTAHALVEAYAIENKRVSHTTTPNTLLVMDKSGSLSALEKINGDTIQSISLIADGRFLVKGSVNSYVINRQGAVLGILKDVSRFGDKFFVAGKIYDSDFTLLFDYVKEGYTLEATLANGLLLRDGNGNLAMYGTESTSPVTICHADSTKSLVHTGDNFVVIEDKNGGTYYDFYNENGANVLTVSQSYYTSGLSFFQSVDIHYSKDGVTVLSAVANDGLATYYILH